MNTYIMAEAVFAITILIMVILFQIFSNHSNIVKIVLGGIIQEQTNVIYLMLDLFKMEQ
jgi:hypothetical protein